MLVVIAIAFVLVALAAPPAEASGDRSRSIMSGAAAMSRDAGRPRFPVRLAALPTSGDVPGVGQPGSWFDRRTDSALKRWWKHRWAVYPGSVGSGWGLKLRFRF